MRLDITEQFLEQMRTELLAFPRAYFDLKSHDDLPLPPPQSVRHWFIGLDGEEDHEVLARVTQTVWWLDVSCPGMAHEVRDHWAFDSFRYSALRFGPLHDRDKATRVLMPVCLAFASVVGCHVCWPHIKGKAPRWTAAEVRY